MKRSSEAFRAGTRASKLALIQTRSVLKRFEELFSGVTFKEVHVETPGDLDRTTDLRVSDPDFFTRDLDEAIVKGKIDFAIHSAKDLPDMMPEGLDWCWLPWKEDPRDVIVLPPGQTMDELPDRPRMGISSERRETWCRRRFPEAQVLPIRGNVDERLDQLDAGDFDIIITAAAALSRLGRQERISAWIPLEELTTPDGQGILAMTFKSDDPRLRRIRSLLVKTVTFAGGGGGDAGACTLDTAKALRRCEVCLYDSLVEPDVLAMLSPAAQAIYVGKRSGAHSMPQPKINDLIALHARRGRRVVRLKGGDPGIFGRLVEETGAMDNLQLPYRVLPGVSGLNTATTGTGILLTRRGVSRGFSVMTPREKGGGVGAVDGAARADLPIVFFMSIGAMDDVVKQLTDDGLPRDTPAAVVFGGGTDEEVIIRGTLADICRKVQQPATNRPGLFIVGEIARYGFNHTWGAMQGRRIMLTCSEALQDKAADLVTDFGGIPVQRPLIRLQLSASGLEHVSRLGEYDWVVLTSPSAVRCFVELLERSNIDVRQVPKLMVCGTGTANELKRFRLGPDAVAGESFGGEGALNVARTALSPGTRVLRLRSDKAGASLADSLRALGAEVDDCVLYDNEHIEYNRLSEFDAVFFASASGVESFIEQWGSEALTDKTVVAIGKPTEAALKKQGARADLIGPEATVDSALSTLAAMVVSESLFSEGQR